MRAKDIPLPHRWPHLVRQAMIHAASLAHCDILYAWSKAENSSAPTAWLKGQIDKLQTELAQTQNQNRILMTRFERIPAQRLPNYSPPERMEILAHKSACGWNLQQTAEAFMLSENTISSWLKRVDDEKLVSLPVPWNKYPDFLRGIAQALKQLVPRMGKKKIVEYFARSGLYLAANTIGRYLKSEDPINPEDLEVSEEEPESKSISSEYPDHVWSLDLTAVPTFGGFWTSLIPNSLAQVCPYCWWILVIINHFSRNADVVSLYNEFRSHEYLGSRTPMEVYNHSPPSAPPLKLVHTSEVPKLELHVSYLEGRKHLPIIDIKKAA